MLSTIGESTGEVLTQLSEYNKSDALVGGLVTIGSTRAATLAVNGMDRLKNDLTPPGFTSSNTNQVFLDIVGKHMFNAPIQQSAIKDVAKAIYTELAAQQGLGDWKENTDESVKLYEEALQLASGQRRVMTDTGEVIFGGMQPVREKLTFIPPNMTVADMEKVFQNLNAESIEAITGQKIDSAYPQKIKDEETYKLIFAGGNQYYISNVEDVDRFGDNVPVLDVDESTILFNPMDFLQPIPEIPGPEVMSEYRSGGASNIQTEQADQTPFTTAQDPAVETKSGQAQRFAFESALKENTKQTEKLLEQIEGGINSGKINEGSLDRLFASIPDDAEGDLFEDYVNFVVDGGKKVYKQWLKTKQ